MPSAAEPGLLVVGGTMRGGTSLLHRLLGSHPDVRMTAGELRALRYVDLAAWSHAAAVWQASLTPRTRRRDAAFRGQVHRYVAAMLRGCRLGELASVNAVHRALAAALAVPGTRWVGDKYPDYVLAYPRYVHRPNTRCIFIYRDPRDVVASIVDRTRAGEWRGRTWARGYDGVERATDYWISIMRALGDVRRLDTNALLVRYEDLVTRPQDAIAVVARHLDVAADGFDGTLPDPSNVGRFRVRLTPTQSADVERRAGDEMERWGYERG